MFVQKINIPGYKVRTDLNQKTYSIERLKSYFINFEVHVP